MKLTPRRLLAASVLAAVATLSAGGAYAATCSIGGTSFTLNPDGAVSNERCIAGNDDGAGGFFGSLDSLFGTPATDYTKAFKNEGANNGGGDGSILFSTTPINDDKSGSWAISSLNGYSKVVVVLKAGSQFGAFLLSGNPLSGTWEASKELSHATIWRTDDTSAVPLPAAGWMLLAGIGGLVAMRRRKASA